jgi:hypothetical protein
MQSATMNLTIARDEQTDDQLIREESVRAFECESILNSMAETITNLVNQKRILEWIG